MADRETQVSDILKEADAHCVALNELIKRAAGLSVALTIKDHDPNPITRLFMWSTGQAKDRDGVEPRLIQWAAELVEVQRTPLRIKREQPGQG